MPIQNKDELIPIDYDEIVFETNLAWLLETAIGEVWVPRSQCSLEGDDKERYCLMPEWLANQKGLI